MYNIKKKKENDMTKTIKKTLLTVLILAVLTAAFAGCGKSAEEIKDIAKEAVNTISGFRAGEWDGNTYTNEKFNLTAAFPEQWRAYSAQELEDIFGEVAKSLKDTENEVEEGIYIPLFFVIDNQDASMAMSNVNLTAARSLLAPDFEAEYTDDALKQMTAQLEQLGTVDAEVVGETDFGGKKAFLVTMNTAIAGTDFVQYQKIYQLYTNGYMLTFTLTSLDVEAMEGIESYFSFD